MSSLFASSVAAGIPAPLETISAGPGGVIADSDIGPTTVNVAIEFRDDGTIFRNQGGVISQIGAWINPTSTASSAYGVRCNNITAVLGTAGWTTQASPEGDWIGIGMTRVWERIFTGSTQVTFTAQFSVRKTAFSLPVQENATYTFDLDATP